MPGKIPISTRISQQDADFLADLKVEGAVTPSDKLRAVIREARHRNLGTEDYPGSLAMAADTLAPTTRIIRSSENDLGIHSELVSRLTDWVSECFAYLVASNGNKVTLSQEELLEVEASLAKRVFVLMESVLQMGVTQRSACYDPKIIRESLESVLDITNVINQVTGGATKT